MGKYFDERKLKDDELFDNPATRVAMCLCVDTSDSMEIPIVRGQSRMDCVNKGIRNFLKKCVDNIYARDSLDFCLITFGGGQAKLRIPFTNVQKVRFDNLEGSGSTPMGAAVELALEEITANKERYSSYGLSSYKPWLIIMSDGEPTDDISNAVKAVNEELEKKKIKVKCIYMGSQDGSGSNEGRKALNRFTRSIAGSTESIDFLDMDNFFEFLSKSVSNLSKSIPGQDENMEDVIGRYGK